MKKKVAVVGGGAAGMMAALAAASCGHQVTVYEKNEKLGKKLFITGKGRCNVTNDCSVEELFNNVITNSKFLYSAFHTFDNNAVQAFFENAGCSLKTERGGRVFPTSDHSSDVIRALERKLRMEGVDIRLNACVGRILTETDEEKNQKRVRGLLMADRTEISADAVILAAGGLSYPATGSTGDGYRMAEEMGHSIRPCSPALVPFIIGEEWCKSLQGLSLKNVKASLLYDERKIWEGFGEMLFTHFGVSGPLILTASSHYAAARDRRRTRDMDNRGEHIPTCRLLLNLKPALTPEQLDKRLLRDFEENKNRDFKNVLDGLFPARLIPVMIKLSGIEPGKKVHEITKEERKNFAGIIQRLPLTVKGTGGFEEAVITRGGVCVKEVKPSTMESRLVNGLYFAGEMLDIDALTGGFNLQIAWSTGYAAGMGTAECS